MKLTIGVANGRDVDVKLVEHGLDVGVGVVLAEELVDDVLCRHGGDPLAGVDVGLEDNSRLGARLGAVDVDALDLATLDGLADGEEVRVGAVLGLDGLEPADVVVILVV